MEFAWTPEQEELFAAARELARSDPRCRSGAAHLNGDGGRLNRAAWEACAQLGLLGLCAPVSHGGLGLDLLTSARVVEGFGEGCEDAGLLFAACAHLFACCTPIAESGSDELHDRTLRRLTSGEWVGANAITEAEAGSDVLALQMRAERDGDEYVLNGSKVYVSNGPVADVAVVYAATNPGGGYLSLSAFVVETGRPGVSAGKPFRTTGLTGCPVGSLYFDDCRVPLANRLGSEGHGALIFNRSMQIERACLFAGYLGAMQRQLDRVVDHARTRRQFGRPIGKNQAISHRIVDMRLRLEAARLLVYRACWLMDSGQNPTVEVSLAKLAVSEAAVQSGLDAIQIHGGMGVVAEAGVDQALYDALPATVFSGTSEMQRELVAARMGL